MQLVRNPRISNYEHCCVLPHAVYLVQGILGLARLAVSYFLKDELHLDPATVRSVMV